LFADAQRAKAKNIFGIHACERTGGKMNNFKTVKDMKGCRKEFHHKLWGDRICGISEDLKHSDHFIYCDECQEKMNRSKDE